MSKFITLISNPTKLWVELDKIASRLYKEKRDEEAKIIQSAMGMLRTLQAHSDKKFVYPSIYDKDIYHTFDNNDGNGYTIAQIRSKYE